VATTIHFPIQVRTLPFSVNQFLFLVATHANNFFHITHLQTKRRRYSEPHHCDAISLSINLHMTAQQSLCTTQIRAMSCLELEGHLLFGRAFRLKSVRGFSFQLQLRAQ
jgi:proline racemase